MQQQPQQPPPQQQQQQQQEPPSAVAPATVGATGGPARDVQGDGAGRAQDATARAAQPLSLGQAPAAGPRSCAGGGARVWVSAAAAVLLLVAVCVGVGACVRCALCDCCQGQEPLLQPQLQQEQQGARQAGGGGPGLRPSLWGAGLPTASLPAWAGGQQLGPPELVSEQACVQAFGC